MEIQTSSGDVTCVHLTQLPFLSPALRLAIVIISSADCADTFVAGFLPSQKANCAGSADLTFA